MNISLQKPTSQSRENRWIGAGLVLFALALYLVIIPREVGSSGGLRGLQPSFMPNLIAFFLGLIGLALVVCNPQGREEEDTSSSFGVSGALWITLGVLFLYPFAAEYLGYYVSSVGILLFFFAFFGCRSYLLMGILSLGVPLCLYWFFAKIMMVMLPQGIFF